MFFQNIVETITALECDCLKVNSCCLGLASQLIVCKGVLFAVLKEMRRALPELEVHIRLYALLTYIKHPLVSQRAAVNPVFAADNYQFSFR